MTTSNPGLTGTFRFDTASATWSWSEQMFVIYGFGPGEVVPTTELVLSHQHPEDRGLVEDALAAARATGRQDTWWHRLVDASGVTRQVVTLAAGDFAEDGRLVAVNGLVVDVTESVRRTTAREVDEAMETMSPTRPFIEEAKGALMVTYGVDAEDAFRLLRHYSQLHHVKVRDVARNIVEALPTGDLPLGTRVTWDGLAAGFTGSELEEFPGA